MNETDRFAALLEGAARYAELPETPPLAERVRARIEAGPLPVAEIRLPRTRPPVWRPVLAGLAVLALAFGLTLAFSVTARRAVADLLGIAGIEITFDDEGDPPVPLPRLDLGERVARAEAAERAGFDVLVPARVTAGGRHAVYYDPDLGSTGMVSVVYPETAGSTDDVDLLVTQFVASVDGMFIKKLALQGADVTYATVGTSTGYWVGGEHLFYYVDADGRPREETVRLAGKVLLWEEGPVTYRVEGAPSLRAALRVARGLR